MSNNFYKIISKLVTSALLLALCNLATAQTIIFEEQFAGGIDSTWQNNPISCGEPDSLHNTLWEWSDDGRADAGAYWGDAGTIQSPSVGNGCALFSSDFLDNNGVAGNFYMGLSPAPHSAELVSPIIDCSAYPNVSLQFYQSYRAFQGETRVEVSADSGATWIPYVLNDDISGNASTDPGDIQLLELSDIAGGAPGVQVKFVFDGRYYFWLVDDVRMIVTPNYNLEVPRAALSVLYGTPVTQRVQMEIDAEVCNQFAQLGQVNTQLNCVIEENGGAVLYDETFVSQDTLPTDSCLGYVIPTMFDMEGLDLMPGVYDMTYTASGDSANFTTNNTYTHQFTVTQNVIRKTLFDSGGGLTVSGGGANEFGYQFYIQNFGDQAMSADFMMAAQGGNTMEGEAATVKIYKIGPDPLNGDMTTDDLIIMGFGTYEFGANYENYDVASVDLFNLDDGEQGIILEPETYYLAMISYAGSNTVFHAINASIDYQYTNAVHEVLIDGAGDLFSGGFNGADRMPVLDIYIAPIDVVATEEVTSSFNTKLYPNPADQMLSLEVDLEEVAKNFNIKITDSFGKLIEERSFENIQKETLNFNTNDYPTGSYLMFLRSDNKVQSQKFVIVH